MIAIKLRRIVKLIGPYPYNPYLIFLFFFSLFISRLAPMIAGLPHGSERWKAAAATLVLSVIPALAFSLGAMLFKKYRWWSAQSTLLYILEIAFFQSFILLYAPIVHNFVWRRFNYDYRAALSTSPIIFVGSLILVLLSFALMHRAELKISGRLNAANQMIRQLESDRRELVEADEFIRGQTSRILHDRVQSDLMVIGMKLKSISGRSTPDVNDVLEKALVRLEETRTLEIRNLIQTLSPNFGAGGLLSALEILKERYQSSIQIAISIDANTEKLDSEILLGIFRIVEQSILNSFLHGPASQVYVEVNSDESGKTKITISDNGAGADLNSSTSGIGSAIINSWVEILKGKKEIDSAPGHGYQISITFPS